MCTWGIFSTTCAVNIEDFEGWWLSGCHSSLAAQALDLILGNCFSPFLYFCLTTSKAVAINPHHFNKHVTTICGASPVVASFHMHRLWLQGRYYASGTSLSEQHIADLMFCYGMQAMCSSRVCHCLLLHDRMLQLCTVVVALQSCWLS